MRAQLTRIGNSTGIRIPKSLIIQTGLGEEVELRHTVGGIAIAPYRSVRRDRKDAFTLEKPSAGLFAQTLAPHYI
jgi:antitoxin component of MazEF toxin-antitoxin module